MLYVVYGTAAEKVSEKACLLRDSLSQEGTAVSSFDAEEFLAAPIEELLGGQGLFENARLIILRNIFENEEGKEKLLSYLEEAGASPNIFILEEGKIDAATKKKISTAAAETFLFEKNQKEAAFNRFAIADALGARDKKRAWVLLIEALRTGAAGEEIAGLLFWQVKAMLLARSHKTAESAGLNPFVFRKAQGFSQNFTDEELNNLSRTLMRLPHESRRGGLELSLALERFVLSL